MPFFESTNHPKFVPTTQTRDIFGGALWSSTENFERISPWKGFIRN